MIPFTQFLLMAMGMKGATRATAEARSGEQYKTRTVHTEGKSAI